MIAMSTEELDPAIDTKSVKMRSPPGPEQLLPLALSRPRDALIAARAVLADRPSSYDASLAHQATGIVLRDRGDLPAAVAELRTGLRLARLSGQPERQVDVQATLGIALAVAGRSRQGLALLDQAVAAARGELAGRVLVRRAAIFQHLGRFRDAHEDLSRALPYLRRVGDTVWEARSLTWRAEAYLALGLPARAAADFARAEELFATSGQDLEYAMARHNLGLVALSGGDLPGALAYFDEAGNRYDALGVSNPDLALDRCRTLLTAGLAAEAAREANSALSRTSPGAGIPYKRAELVFAAATAALAAGDPGAASPRARQAQRLFRAQGRDTWAARAGLILAQARYAGGERSVRLLRYAEQVAARLEACRASEAMQAHLLAGRVALSRGAVLDAARHLERAARSRRRKPPLTRSVAWLARALQADAGSNARATIAACTRGLAALEEHQLTLGATELRAYGTAHGAELALLAQRDALRRGDVRRLLFWSERWRATTLAAGVTRPQQDDRALVAELGALRSVARLLETPEIAASRRNALEHERRRLETAVQARVRRSPGRGPGQPAASTSARCSTSSAGPAWSSWPRWTACCTRSWWPGRVRLHPVGGVPDREVQLSRFILRRLAHRPPSGDDEPVLAYRGAMLEAALLGPAAAALGDGPVVVIPPGRLAAVPWTLMPSLRDRVVTVAPSAASWMRARRQPPPPGRRVALVAGPRLAGGGAEVGQLHARYPQAELLGHGTATAERVLRALDGAWLAHIAAHGTFRADNPLFSSLELDDGPLTVYDFERLGRAPHHLLLPSCDSAIAAAVGADELLGLVSSLIPLGAASIVASVVPVNDLAAAPLMLALHAALQRGAALPEALLSARADSSDDPQAAATAHSFLALGG